MLYGPNREMLESTRISSGDNDMGFRSLPEILTAAVPEPSVLTLPRRCQLSGSTDIGGYVPRSPTCLSDASGPPWFLPWGLKWGPADVQPLELSPNSLRSSVSKRSGGSAVLN
jgi:hypothetical protein